MVLATFGHRAYFGPFVCIGIIIQHVSKGDPTTKWGSTSPCNVMIHHEMPQYKGMLHEKQSSVLPDLELSVQNCNKDVN